MRIVSSGSDGENWQFVHDLSLPGERQGSCDAVHLLTLLAQYFVEDARASRVLLQGLALENKLFAVHAHDVDLGAALDVATPRVLRGATTTSAEPQQRLVVVLDAYLNAIYGALELAAGINRAVNRDAPIGFSKQAKKVAAFSFDRWQWLRSFYDLRREMSHFSTAFFRPRDQAIILQLLQGRETEIYEKGQHAVPVALLREFRPELLRMLNAWAEVVLTGLDPTRQIEVFDENGRTSTIPAAQLLGLARPTDSSE